MNRTGAPPNTWLLCLIYVCYLLNHISCEALDGDTPLFCLTGITPDISIITLYTFYQPVFYATYDQHFPSESVERSAFWVGFGEHVGDALTHKLLDMDSFKIIYRSAVRPQDSRHPNLRLSTAGGESRHPNPILFIKSRHDDNPSVHKPMPGFNPDDLLGKTFLMPVDENGERHHATVSQKIIERMQTEDDNLPDKINFILNVGEGRAQSIISYNQLLDYIERSKQEDEDVYKFKCIIAHQGPLKPDHHDWKGSKYNLLIEWESGEQTYTPLSVIAKDDPVTCTI
jgi:hypothetical protein